MLAARCVLSSSFHRHYLSCLLGRLLGRLLRASWTASAVRGRHRYETVVEGYLPVGVGESERELGAVSGPWAGPEHFLEVEKTEGGPSVSLAS